ncbi:MAG: hypothetical protein R3B70_05860 [Polyangiaceae bacterium]
MQDAYESKLEHISDLEAEGKSDEALACLDTILEANRHQDHDGWLAWSIADHRALILQEAGRYLEALQASAALADLGFADVSQRWSHAVGAARALEALGRDREAVAVLEDSLRHEDEKYLPAALSVLGWLVHISDKLALPVDPKWLRTAEAVARYHGVAMPTGDSPGKAILALEDLLRSKQ